MLFSVTRRTRFWLRFSPTAVSAVAIGCASPTPASSDTDGGTQSSASAQSSSASPSSGGAPSASASTGGGPSGSSASTTGSSGSGTTGASPDGGIGGAAAAVHDDFESGALSSTWSLTDQNGVPNTQYTPVTSVTVDTAQAHSGTHSVKIASGNGGFFGVAPPSADFYGRAWVYLGASPGTGHWAFVEGVGPGSQGSATQVRIGGNLGTYDVNIQTTGGEDEIRAAADGGAVPPPAGRWMCVEFHYGTDTLQFWQDGASILDVTATTTWQNGLKAPWSPQYVMIRFGYVAFGAAATDVWFDDVALDASRIGCN